QGCPSKRLLGIPAISINLHAATQLVYLLLGHQCAVCPPIPALPTPLAFALGLGLGRVAALFADFQVIKMIQLFGELNGYYSYAFEIGYLELVSNRDDEADAALV
ncbi:MAG: hypothetical protein MJE77_09755, partial [Proteobacteria bacterium]|nr:hypothetical protein [Pseudomonadota bacterium]